jgi:hypothetical protein
LDWFANEGKKRERDETEAETGQPLDKASQERT